MPFDAGLVVLFGDRLFLGSWRRDRSFKTSYNFLQEFADALGIAAKIVAAVARGGSHVDTRRHFVPRYANNDVIGKTEDHGAV